MPKQPIDPDRLLKLCRQRHHNGSVTLGWPCMLHIIEQLRQQGVTVFLVEQNANQALKLEKLEKIDSQQGAHPHQQWADAKAALDEYKEACQ